MPKQIVREELNKGEVRSQETVDIKGLVIYLILLVITLIGLLVLFYFFFFANSVSDITSEQYRSWAGDVSDPTEWKTQTEDSGQIDAEDLNDLEQELLQETSLSQLEDFSVDISLEPIGKENPFIPWSSAPANRFVVPDEEEEVLEESDIPNLE